MHSLKKLAVTRCMEKCMKITLFEKDLLKNDCNDVLKGG